MFTVLMTSHSPCLAIKSSTCQLNNVLKGSVIPGDLPNTIVKEFTVELVNPLSILYNNIAQTSSWPEEFKVEYVTPIGKIPLPQSEDDLLQQSHGVVCSYLAD